MGSHARLLAFADQSMLLSYYQKTLLSLKDVCDGTAHLFKNA
jgi:hypothetical protein